VLYGAALEIVLSLAIFAANSTSDVKTTEAAIQPKDSNDMQLESNIGAQQKEKTEPAEKSQPVATKTATSTAPVSNIIPTIIQNGRQICNLPDHPIHAGCTAIVAVLIGRTLTVANAGDSRAVLCRAGGRAEPLSFDHKPNQDREMARIGKAGGFVNQFGRVNGNLNLSRSIGDLKYKQMPGLTPAEQMITAEPDILQ
jgi:serine/threonine protein phosphatase PrpC